MTNLQKAQNKVIIVSTFLFGKETKIPKTIKECEKKLQFYYNCYGETYFTALKKQDIKVVINL